MRLWDLGTFRPRSMCTSRSPATVVAFSPDGRTLAIGQGDHRVVLCDVATNRKVVRWSANGRVTSLAFSHDGSQLAAGDDTGHVNRWDASAWLGSPKALRRRVCQTLRAYHPGEAEWHDANPHVDFADLCR